MENLKTESFRGKPVIKDEIASTFSLWAKRKFQITLSTCLRDLDSCAFKRTIYWMKAIILLLSKYRKISLMVSCIWPDTVLHFYCIIARLKNKHGIYPPPSIKLPPYLGLCLCISAKKKTNNKTPAYHKWTTLNHFSLKKISGKYF